MREKIISVYEESFISSEVGTGRRFFLSTPSQVRGLFGPRCVLEELKGEFLGGLDMCSLKFGRHRVQSLGLPWKGLMKRLAGDVLDN